MLHYVVKGKGYFQDLQTVHSIKAGDIFLIIPGIPTLYYADMEDPWEYIWVGFSGKNTDKLIRLTGLSVQTPVINSPDCFEFFSGMLDESHNNGIDPTANSLRILGELLRMIAFLSSANSKQNYMISDRIAEFLQNNMSRQISISQMAADFGFSRTYLSSVFKKEKGISPRQYLTNLRLEKARVMLLETDFKISHIARSVGYEDPLLFSKQFKAKHKMGPRQMRNYYRKLPSKANSQENSTDNEDKES